MAQLYLFQCFPEDLAEKKHNLGSDTIKAMLTNVDPSAGTALVKSDITEISAGNGYSAGGTAVTLVQSAQSGGFYSYEIADIVYTASGGTIGPFRWIVLYNDTAAGKNLIGYMDYSATKNIFSSQSLTIAFPGNAISINP